MSSHWHGSICHLTVDEHHDPGSFPKPILRVLCPSAPDHLLWFHHRNHDPFAHNGTVHEGVYLDSNWVLSLRSRCQDFAMRVEQCVQAQSNAHRPRRNSNQGSTAQPACEKMGLRGSCSAVHAPVGHFAISSSNHHVNPVLARRRSRLSPACASRFHSPISQSRRFIAISSQRAKRGRRSTKNPLCAD